MTALRVTLALLGALVVLPALLLPSAIEAQRRPAAPDPLRVRAELAEVLLQNARYEEAVAEYRTLLAQRPDQVEWRLGLARAYAWGGRARDAERELRRLLTTAPGDTAAVALIRSVRAGIEPTADEATQWLAEDRWHRPYRRQLARALAREGSYALAIAHLDTLLAAEETPALLREAAGVHGVAGDSSRAALLLGRAVQLAPLDTGVRRAYAGALAWSGNRAGAISQYSILIRQNDPPDPRWLLERARLHIWAADYAPGERDLLRSIALSPSYEAYAALGDSYRWRGSWGRAREAYGQALALRPRDAAVLAALAQLSIEERMAVATGPLTAQPGWTSLSTWSEDNAGFLYLATGLSRGFAVSHATTLSLGAEQRRVSQRSHVDEERYIQGWAVHAGASTTLGQYALDGRVGMSRHAIVGNMPFGSVAVSTWMSPIRFSAQAMRGPVYEMLMSTQTLAQWEGGELRSSTALTASGVTAGFGIPIGDADVSLSAMRLWLSDGNSRGSVFGSIRYALRPGIALLYSGGALGFTDESPLYWDPHRHSSHRAGAELSRRGTDGFSAAARVLAGVGRTTEVVSLDDGAEEITFRSRPIPQLSTSGEVGYRSGRWDATAALAYGRGRDGGYQSLAGTLRVRLTW